MPNSGAREGEIELRVGTFGQLKKQPDVSITPPQDTLFRAQVEVRFTDINTGRSFCRNFCHQSRETAWHCASGRDRPARFEHEITRFAPFRDQV
jgi:hypothetical protein